MRLSHEPMKTRASFDDPNLVFLPTGLTVQDFLVRHLAATSHWHRWPGTARQPRARPERRRPPPAGPGRAGHRRRRRTRARQQGGRIQDHHRPAGRIIHLARAAPELPAPAKPTWAGNRRPRKQKRRRALNGQSWAPLTGLPCGIMHVIRAALRAFPELPHITQGDAVDRRPWGVPTAPAAKIRLNGGRFTQTWQAPGCPHQDLAGHGTLPATAPS